MKKSHSLCLVFAIFLFLISSAAYITAYEVDYETEGTEPSEPGGYIDPPPPPITCY